MKIVNRIFVCPKCKKQYMNEFLAGYHSMFAEAADSFKKSNVIKAYCEDCDEKLVTENLLKHFDEKGMYAPVMEECGFYEDVDDFKIYLKVLEIINSFFSCTKNGKIEIISKLDREEKGIKAYILVKGKVEEKEYDLLKINASEYEFEMGDRKNAFVIKTFEKMVDAVASGIYEYLFEDDCSIYYNKKHEANIYYKAM